MSLPLAPVVLTKPEAVGLGVAALVVLYLAFKATKFLLKLILALAALAVLGLAAWWYYTAHHSQPF